MVHYGILFLGHQGSSFTQMKVPKGIGNSLGGCIVVSPYCTGRTRNKEVYEAKNE